MSGSNSKDFRSVPPPEHINKRQSYSKCDEISSNNNTFDYNYVNRKRRPKTDDDYFDDDNDDNQPLNQDTNQYIPKPGSPSERLQTVTEDVDNEDSEEDPLDAFMAELDKESKTSNHKKGFNPSKSMSTMSMKTNVKKKVTNTSNEKGIRDDIESEDLEESYYRYMEENPNAGIGTLGGSDDEGVDVQYDSDGNPSVANKSKMIDPLPPIYHSEISYEPFEKNFYVEHEDITQLEPNQVIELRKKLGIQVSGPSPLKPVTSFGHFGFDEQLMKVIRKLEYTQPSPIQAQAVPTALSGRDIIGIAKTGSGKTAAFIWPLLVHIMDQKELKSGDGPIGLILAPTRELAQQIYTEAKRFGKVYDINVVCAYGGGNKYEQSKDLELGAEIVVATPVCSDSCDSLLIKFKLNIISH